MNSFIPWVGGKSQLRNTIYTLFPEKRPELYVEVFGGAGWVLFGKEQHSLVEVFNDKDGHLINLYRCIQNHCEELQREILKGGAEYSFNSKELFDDYLAQLNIRGLTDIQRAARYFYLIRISYGARKETYCCHKRSMNSATARLPEIQERLKNVVIENRDFEKLIKTYNRSGALFYIDPPYYNAEGFYQGFCPDDHLRLLKCVEKIKGKFILSYNDVDEIRSLYKGYNIVTTERQNSLAAKNGPGLAKYKELIITNY